MKGGIKSFGAVLILGGVLLFAWTVLGHNYRYSIEEQTATWYDGVETYRFERGDWDSFDPVLYERVRSVDEAVAWIAANYEVQTEEQRLLAVYDFTRQRFMHFMYPHHTWRTNPYLALADTIAPTRSWNQMARADDKLRHSAVASCGHAANVFIECYRAMGGEAQKVSFSGHNIAEARIGGQRYFVDANLERFMQGG